MPSSLALNPLPLKDPGGGALSLTRLSGIGAAIVALLTTVNGAWNTIFGTNTPTWAKPVFLSVVVAVWAVIAAADILGRSYVAGQKAAAQGGAQVIPLPGLKATYIPGTDATCVVAGARVDPTTPDDPDFLVVKADGTAGWVARDELKFG